MFSRFLDFLFPPREDEKITRSISDETLSELVLVTPVSYTEPETSALLPFRDPRVRALIHEAKYHGSERAFTLLAGVLADYLIEWRAEEVFSRVVLIPLPLSKERRKTRGFNQAEEVARRAAEIAGLPLSTNTLVKIRDTGSQVTLSRAARKVNMYNAFTALEPLDPSFTYILIDDVVTTGATFQAAIDALRAGGAVHIIPLALAH